MDCWDRDFADRAFVRAIERNPGNADARALYSHLLMIVDRPEKASAQIERALELDPLNPGNQAFFGVFLAFAGSARRSHRAVPGSAPPAPFRAVGAVVLLHVEGMHAEALEEARNLFAAPSDREVRRALERGYQRGGYRGALHGVAEAGRKRASSPPNWRRIRTR